MSLSSEIVVVDDPIQFYDAQTIIPSLTFTDHHDHDHDHDEEEDLEPFDSERLPPTLATEIQKFLRVANLIQSEEPRIAYLCRFHAFEIAHNLDRNSTGRGVRQFKTSLLQRLEQDEETTIRRRKEQSDVRELRRVYHAYKEYIIRHRGAFDLEHSHREKLINARRIASVLYEVLKTVTNAADHQALADRDSIHSRPKFYVPYNILPLDHGGIHNAIMQLPEIQAAVAAVRNVRGLPSPQIFHKHGNFIDLFEFLQCSFGFQEGNIANQREHLILLLANCHSRKTNNKASLSRLGDEALDDLMKRFFKNYTDWCKFLERRNNIRLPVVKQEAQQYKILYIALYLLIWGEAANLRFMPECLCFIFHHMAYELHGMVTGAVSLKTLEKVMPAYGGGKESFLNNVITPIYRVTHEEAQKNKSGTAYSTWRNYDDLNEYFWSPDCFEIGWPMRLDHDFFCVQSTKKHKVKKARPPPTPTPTPTPTTDVENHTEEVENHTEENENEPMVEEEIHEPKWLGKTNFVEIRSFWQIFRSFGRMWGFFIMSLQALVIMAYHDLKYPLDIFDKEVFDDVTSIFVTSAFLRLIEAILDIAFAWKARTTMEYSEKVKQVLKMVVAGVWTIVLPVLYTTSGKKYSCYSSEIQPDRWFDELCFSPYLIAVAIYLMTDAIELVLFFVPAIRKYIEVSNFKICTFLLWWTQSRLYIGRGMQETQLSVLKYTFFWVLLLCSKFTFSYYFEIRPLIKPTKEIMEFGEDMYDWHELFPVVKSNAGAIVAVWAPVTIVYFMDTQIWYSVFCAIFGGLYGILHHLGEIRTLGMLRSRFHTLPSAFNVRLIPPPLKNDQSPQNNLLRMILFKGSDCGNDGIAKFVLSFPSLAVVVHLINKCTHRELDLMTIPISSELFSGMVRWPIFLLANKFSTALSIAKDFVGKDEILFRKIRKDNYMLCAVKECYESLKYILEILVVGDLEKRVISRIINEIEDSIERSSFLEEFRLNELPALQAKCVELAELLVEGNENHHGKVVKVLQDMFELITNDLMVNGDRILEFLNSMQPVEDVAFFCRRIDPQLFESYAEKNSIHFPLPDTGPMNEQIRRFLLLITIKDEAMDMPANLEARRRISFFATSLFMNMPSAPTVRNMVSFSVMTPHYLEDINFSMRELESSNEQVSILFYMQKIFPDEWKNFLERLGCENVDGVKDDGREEDLRNWASFRGQTLARTVRGMMYYREALKLQAFLDMAEDEDILEGYDTCERNNRTLSVQLDALADMKFTYVVSCQMYGHQKLCGDPHAQDVLDLMIKYPSLRVAYVQGREEIVEDKPQKVYYSMLVKAVNGFDQCFFSRMVHVISRDQLCHHWSKNSSQSSQTVNIGRQKFSANYQLVFRLFKAFMFIGVLSVIISLSLICKLSVKDIIVCCLAFLPTGWGLIMIAQAIRPKIDHTGLWEFTKVLAKWYDYGMGVVLFAPIAILAWLPIISAFQTRFLFNQAFNRRLQIQPILAGKKKKNR
ncbi:hypothetical protein ACFE04_009091 [Oxalis oulophora]